MLCSTNWCPVKQKQQKVDSEASNEPITDVTPQTVHCLNDSYEGDKRDGALPQEWSNTNTMTTKQTVAHVLINNCGENGECDLKQDTSNTKKETGYYRCKKKHASMYKQMTDKYQRYITRDMLKMVLHFFDTQKNEAMNTSIMKYAPKSKTYCKTLSLKVRVCIAASTNCTGHEAFWKKVLHSMKLEMSPEL